MMSLFKKCVEKNANKKNLTTAYVEIYRRFTDARIFTKRPIPPEQNDSFANGRPLHVPVLVDKVIEYLKPCSQQTLVDMTFGAGGHTRSLLSTCKDFTIYALDRDSLAHKLAVQLSETHPQVRPLRGKFSAIGQLLQGAGVMENSVDGILFDVGASSMQFDTADRGFALAHDGPLDMRMDREHDSVTAGDIVNFMSEEGLYDIIKKYGEEKQARVIARAIVDTRYTHGHITTTTQLAAVIASIQRGVRTDSLQREAHGATKTFQALRIAVNDELNELHNGLELAYRLLRPGGVCVAITFHSLEDRIVKRHFHGIDIDETVFKSIVHRRRSYSHHSPSVLQRLMSRRWQPLTRTVVASPDEVTHNPRARSTKLRAACKVES